MYPDDVERSGEERFCWGRNGLSTLGVGDGESLRESGWEWKVECSSDEGGEESWLPCWSDIALDDDE